ncbi:hypothetical protein ACHAW6_010277 [Cyclotella cf. meneghiniana]
MKMRTRNTPSNPVDNDEGSFVSARSVSSVLSKVYLGQVKPSKVKNGSKKHAILLLQQDGLSLANMSPTLQNTRSSVIAAVRQNGMALQYASPKLQNNQSVVKAAVSENGLALQYASPSQQADSKIAMTAVKQNGMALQHVSSRLANSKSIVMAAVRSNGMALEYASPEMRNEEEVVTTAVLRDSKAVKFAGSEYASRQKELVLNSQTQDMPNVEIDDGPLKLLEEGREEVQVDERDEATVRTFSEPTPSLWEFMRKFSSVSTRVTDNRTKKEESFTFFENMGRRVDNACRDGYEIAHNLCQSMSGQKQDKEAVAETGVEENDLVMKSEDGTVVVKSNGDDIREF